VRVVDEVSDEESLGDFPGGAYVFAALPTRTIGVVFVLGAFDGPAAVGAPPGGDGDAVEVGGDLESEPHGGGDHEPAARPNVFVGVLIGVDGTVVGGFGGHAGGELRRDRVPKGAVGVRLRIAGVGEPAWCDSPDRVRIPGRRLDDFPIPVHRPQQLALQDLGQVLPTHPSRPIGVKGQLVGHEQQGIAVL
jgi:hypothetical protein